jgi:uncharacterized membrane protein
MATFALILLFGYFLLVAAFLAVCAATSHGR